MAKRRPVSSKRRADSGMLRRLVRTRVNPLSEGLAPASAGARGADESGWVEVEVDRAGFAPVRALLRSDGVTAAALRELQASAPEIRRLTARRGRGAVDVRLEDAGGAVVKSGTVTLRKGNASIEVEIDPTARRFRRDDLPPGKYSVRAASAEAGTATVALEVRSGDITRTAIRLKPAAASAAKATLVVPLRGVSGAQVHVVARDKITGRVAFDGAIPVKQSRIELALPAGRFHVHLSDGQQTSCYDADVHDPKERPRIDLRLVELGPPVVIDPGDPPPWLAPLSEFHALAPLLAKLGVRSLEALAAAEGESLMHRAAERIGPRRAKGTSRSFARAITAARQHLGLEPVHGLAGDALTLPRGKAFERQLLPAAAGTVRLDVQLAAGSEAELVVEWEGGSERRVIGANAGGGIAAAEIEIQFSESHVRGGRPMHVSLKNLGARKLTGSLMARLPGIAGLGGVILREPTVKERIEGIYRALEPTNRGIRTTVADAVLAPANIQGWIRNAQTWMARAGVCSIDDLGRFRLDPMVVLRPGLYIAPAKMPLVAPTLLNFAFNRVLGGSVLHYLHNDLLHETAVVMAGTWDILGQPIVLAPEVRELLIIVRKILHDSGSSIGWQPPALYSAHVYHPNPAPPSPDGAGPGDAGFPGTPGEANPHVSINGGANAVTPGPIITAYVLDATNGLPPINLKGQVGGNGGRGQDGGRGGNGHHGVHAEGTFFGGCCREAGPGGNGGAGGAGGRGGSGGNGGEGGKITVLTTPPSLLNLFYNPPSIDVSPGAGGVGGDAGNPGAGGTGGPAGSADCEIWCDDHPERRGADAGAGPPGEQGFLGSPGPNALPDALQFLPITEEQWNQELNKPHVFSIVPAEAEPGTTITVHGEHFDPALDQVYYEGDPMGAGTVTSSTKGTFVVPLTAEGGLHPVMVRQAGSTTRVSNKAMLHVLPKVDPIAERRWIENQNVTIAGLAFRPGAKVIAEDWSQAGHPGISLPVNGVQRTAISVKIPGAPLLDLQGVKRIRVLNPDGGISRDERVVAIGETIIVRVSAFRVVGQTTGITTSRTNPGIELLFTAGSSICIDTVWAPAKIAFRLAQPLQTVMLSDGEASLLPDLGNNNDNSTRDQAIQAAAPTVPHAINVFFFRDTERGSAYAWFFGGPIMYGDDDGDLVGDVDYRQIVAHEFGHALGVHHVCGKHGETQPEIDSTLFARLCQTGDEVFLMYPYWNASDDTVMAQSQIDTARAVAATFEIGTI